MKKALALILSLALAVSALTACGGGTAATPAPAEDDGTIHILATTYPVYRSRQHIWFRPGIRRALRRKDGGHRLAHVCRG